MLPSRNVNRYWSFRLRLALWLVVWLAISLTNGGGFWTEIGKVAFLDSLKNSYNLLLLLLGVLWLYDNRGRLVERMRDSGPGLATVVLGVALAILAWLMPRWDWTGAAATAIIAQVVAALGLFIALFPRAVRLPVMAVAPVGLALLIKMVISSCFAAPFSVVPAAVVVAILGAAGLPISRQGIDVSVAGPSGEIVTASLGLACSGHYAVGLAVGLVLLMVMEARLPLKKIMLLGLGFMVGAWLQNVVRLCILFAVCHFWGSTAMCARQEWLGAVLCVALAAPFV